MRALLLDTSFLFALYREGDAGHAAARESFATLFARPENVLLVAWPVLYESFNSKFSGNRSQVLRLESEWSGLRERKQLTIIDDTPFRERPLNDWWRGEVNKPKDHYRGLSLVDRVLRAILQNWSPKIEALLTLDLRDFGDVCSKMRVEVIP